MKLEEECPMKKYLLAMSLLLATGTSFAAGPSADDLASTKKLECPFAKKGSRDATARILPSAKADLDGKIAPTLTYNGRPRK
jgi:hypothetical protein